MDLDELDVQIRIAKADLDDARRAWQHSPNNDSAQLAAIAEARLNRLLERRWLLATAEAVVRG